MIKLSDLSTVYIGQCVLIFKAVVHSQTCFVVSYSPGGTHSDNLINPHSVSWVDQHPAAGPQSLWITALITIFKFIFSIENAFIGRTNEIQTP